MKKTLILTAAALVALALTNSNAIMVILDSWREVGVSGYAGGSGYEERQTLAGPGVFAGEAQGVADASSPPIPWPQAWSGHGESTSQQSSIIGENGISGSSRVDILSWTGLPDPGHPGREAEARAWSAFDVTFAVDEAQAYELGTRYYQELDGWWQAQQHLNFSFLGATTGEVLHWPQWGWETGWVSGVLSPDVYTLSIGMEIFGQSDPLGDLGLQEWDFDLRVTPVPDSGPGILLLGLASIGVIILHRRVLA